MICPNCNVRPGTLTWAGEMDSVSIARNPPTDKWCAFCVAWKQLEYAQKLAATIPELRQRIIDLAESDAKSEPA